MKRRYNNGITLIKLIIIIATLLIFVGISVNIFNKSQNVDEEAYQDISNVTKITIPESFFRFANSKAEETAKSLNGILEKNNSDWHIEIIIKNCHTGNIVAEGSLPESGLHFDQDEWDASYKN